VTEAEHQFIRDRSVHFYVG